MIDCDIHNTIPSLEALHPYLPDHWCDYIRNSAFVGPDVNDYPGRARIADLPESQPGNGGPPGSDPALVKTRVLHAHDIGIGLLTCNYWVQCIHDEDLAASMATAINDWQRDVWLEPERVRTRKYSVSVESGEGLAEEDIPSAAETYDVSTGQQYVVIDIP